MSLSQDGIDFIARHEGLRLTAYDDGNGKWTIGYGHTLEVNQGDTCTKEQALAWLEEDSQKAENGVNGLLWGDGGKKPAKSSPSLTQPQFDALVDFTFNLGAGNFAKSSILRNLYNENLTEAANSIWNTLGPNGTPDDRVWCKSGGVVNKGICNRRMDEKKLFLEGVYA
jgi:lysozyme